MTGAGSDTGGLACGIDVVDVASFSRAVGHTKGRMLNVCFTAVERETSCDRLECLAARFAAKEAAAKVLGVGLLRGVGFCDIEIPRTLSERPRLRLYRQAQKLADAQGFSRWAVSISHEAGIAVAMVVACRA